MHAPLHKPRFWLPRLCGFAARLCVVGASLGLSGCKDPTVVLTTVQPDNFVPLFTQLTLTLTSASDPSIYVSSNLVSLYPGSYDGGLPIIPLPGQFPLSVDPDYLSGAAIVRADGIDNASGTLLATGSATAQVVPQKQTEATVTLSPVACQPAGTDGGSGCDGGADAGHDAAAGRDAAAGG
jgi:hypothetical protein